MKTKQALAGEIPPSVRTAEEATGSTRPLSSGQTASDLTHPHNSGNREVVQVRFLDRALKQYQIAHAWWEDAEWQVSILYINRLHRSGEAGEYWVDQAEQWAKKCEIEMNRAREKLANEHAKIDEEYRILEDIEAQMVEDIRFLWKRTRDMAGHDGWVDVWDPELGEYFCTGCDCNRYNRAELRLAIQRLRFFRQGTYQA